MKKITTLLLLFFTLNLRAQSTKTLTAESVINVLAIDDKKQPQVQTSITFVSTKDKKEYSGMTDVAGKFTINLPTGQSYKVRYKAFASVESDLSIELPASPTPYSMNYTITVTPPQTFTLDNVFFDSGKSNLRPESSMELNELVTYMQLKKELKIEIGGHTDNVGDVVSNLKLSTERANAVRAYLLSKGIAPARVEANGYGDTQPIADNATTAGRQQNRRTEVNIISN
jgi:OOP family OmpA-OmpF porin